MLERHMYLIVRIKLDELSMGVCKASGCSTAGIVLRSGVSSPLCYNSINCQWVSAVLKFSDAFPGVPGSECSHAFSFATASEREFPNKVASSCALRGPRSAFSNSTHLETSWV